MPYHRLQLVTAGPQEPPAKDTWPGLYDISAAGHIESGADSLATALRELGEELGVVLPGELRRAFTCAEEFAPFGGCNAYADVYLAAVDADTLALRLGGAEVTGVRWEGAEALLSKLAAKLREVQRGVLDGEDVVPRSEAYVARFKEELQCLGAVG